MFSLMESADLIVRFNLTNSYLLCAFHCLYLHWRVLTATVHVDILRDLKGFRGTTLQKSYQASLWRAISELKLLITAFHSPLKSYPLLSISPKRCYLALVLYIHVAIRAGLIYSTDFSHVLTLQTASERNSHPATIHMFKSETDATLLDDMAN